MIISLESNLREIDGEQFCETKMLNPQRAKLRIKETVGVLPWQS